MKILLDKVLLLITAIVAVSATSAGVYYVSSIPEPVRHIAQCSSGQKAPWSCVYYETLLRFPNH